MTHLVPGTPIAGGKYILVTQLGEGGQSQVWQAQQHGLEGFSKDVVLKFILADHEANQLLRGMLLHEAQIVARLTHPNIVQIFDIGQEDDRLYLAMERIKGRDLDALQEAYQQQYQCPIPWPLVLAIISQMCAGLHHAHTLADEQRKPLEIIHRDLKPENILLSEDGFVKLIDFGIAKSSSKGNTKTGSVKGTPAYMSPEQIKALKLDHRSDIFALGSILHELCSGELAFSSPDLFSIAFLIMQQDPPPLRSLQPHIPHAVEALVSQCLAKQVDDRPPDARYIRRIMEGILQQEQLLITQEDLAEVAQALHQGLPLPTLDQLLTYNKTGSPDLTLVPQEPLLFPSTTPQQTAIWGLQHDTDAHNATTTDPQPPLSAYQQGFAEPELPTGDIQKAGNTAYYDSPATQVSTQQSTRHSESTDPLPMQPPRPATPQPPTLLVQKPMQEAPSLNVDPQPSAAAPTATNARWLLALSGILLLIAGVGLGLMLQPKSRTQQSPPPTKKPRQPRNPAIPSLPPLGAVQVPTNRTVPALPQPTHTPALARRKPPSSRKRRRRRRIRYGQLRIEISPTCKIYAKGRYLGLSNGLRVRRPHGRFRFRCICRSCRFQHNYSVRIKSRRQTFTKHLRTGKVLLLSKPWSAVHLPPFGKLGFTQQHLILYEGQYTFVLHKRNKPYFRKRVTILVKPGRLTKNAPIFW